MSSHLQPNGLTRVQLQQLHSLSQQNPQFVSRTMPVPVPPGFPVVHRQPQRPPTLVTHPPVNHVQAPHEYSPRSQPISAEHLSSYIVNSIVQVLNQHQHQTRDGLQSIETSLQNQLAPLTQAIEDLKKKVDANFNDLAQLVKKSNDVHQHAIQTIANRIMDMEKVIGGCGKGKQEGYGEKKTVLQRLDAISFVIEDLLERAQDPQASSEPKQMREAATDPIPQDVLHRDQATNPIADLVNAEAESSHSYHEMGTSPFKHKTVTVTPIRTRSRTPDTTRHVGLSRSVSLDARDDTGQTLCALSPADWKNGKRYPDLSPPPPFPVSDEVRRVILPLSPTFGEDNIGADDGFDENVFVAQQEEERDDPIEEHQEDRDNLIEQHEDHSVPTEQHEEDRDDYIEQQEKDRDNPIEQQEEDSHLPSVVPSSPPSHGDPEDDLFNFEPDAISTRDPVSVQPSESVPRASSPVYDDDFVVPSSRSSSLSHNATSQSVAPCSQTRFDPQSPTTDVHDDDFDEQSVARMITASTASMATLATPRKDEVEIQRQPDEKNEDSEMSELSSSESSDADDETETNQEGPSDQSPPKKRQRLAVDVSSSTKRRRQVTSSPTKRNNRNMKTPTKQTRKRRSDAGKPRRKRVYWPLRLVDEVGGTHNRFIQCDGCHLWFHWGCVGLKSGNPILDDDSNHFACPACSVGK
ncbi:hypothetical protein L218DRAFT_283342 [Marasmius fiardii PR-910]|nr:hypothetical protein L218DRAFT_283342 [Marasmius fiardii PR-910]